MDPLTHCFFFLSRMQLTQQRSIDHFFSNVTWNKIEELEKLNEDSFDFELATHWRNPSIFLTLSLFIVTRVSDYVCIPVESPARCFPNTCMRTM